MLAPTKELAPSSGAAIETDGKRFVPLAGLTQPRGLYIQMLPCTQSARPRKTSKFGTYFHLPRMPVPRLSLGTLPSGVEPLTIVQPVADATGGGVTVQTRPSPHHSLKSLRTGSNSRPQVRSRMLPLESSVGNSPVGSVGVTRVSKLAGPGLARFQKIKGWVLWVDKKILRTKS